MASWRDRLAPLRERAARWSARFEAFGVLLARVGERIGFGLLKPLLVGCALVALGVYVWLGVVHLRYPFEIEWMEGGMLDEVQRALAGKKIYVKPSVDFVPFIYAPLWFYVAAGFGKILGVSFFSARLVSFLASLGVAAFIFRIVQRETRSLVFAIAAAGLFTGTYRLATAFYDIARVDSLFVLLFFAGLYVLRFRTSIASRLVAAVLFTLAFLTKQSGSFLFLPIALHVLLEERRRGLAFALTGGALMGGSVALLNWVHGGWFWYYVFWVPRQHPWVKRMWWGFWLDDLLTPLALGIALGLYFVFVGPDGRSRRLYVMAFLGALAVSWTGRLHAGGWPNVIMPGFAMIALLFGLGLHAGFARAAGYAPHARRRAQALYLLLGVAQFAVLVYDPMRYVPSDKDRQAGEEVLKQIRAIDGDVWASAHGHLTSKVGKRAFAHEMAIMDLIGTNSGRPGAQLREDIKRAFAEKRFAGVVSDGDWFRKEIEQTYKRKNEIFTKGDVFWPVTGFRARPRTMFVPK
jgi:hypothetical protein